MSIEKLLPRLAVVAPIALMLLISILFLMSCSSDRPLTEDEALQRINEPIPTSGPSRNFPADMSRDEADESRMQQAQPFFEATDFEGGHECEGLDTYLFKWWATDHNKELKAEWEALEASGKWDEADTLEIYAFDEWVSIAKDLCPSVY